MRSPAFYGTVPRGQAVRFDAYIPLLDSAEVKRVARAYIGSQVYKLRKDECTAAL